MAASAAPACRARTREPFIRTSAAVESEKPGFPLLEPVSQGVPPLVKLATELGDQGVLDRRVTLVGLDEMSLGHICCVLSSVDEHVIPRQIFWWTRPRHQLIPLVGALKRRIDIKDHTAIAESCVMDDLPHKELSRVIHGIRVTEKRPRLGIGRRRRRRQPGQPDLVAFARVLRPCRAMPRFRARMSPDDDR